MTAAVTVNGMEREVAPGTTVGDLVAQIAPQPSGVAAALNGAVVVRADWARIALSPGDRVEIVSATPGG